MRAIGVGIGVAFSRPMGGYDSDAAAGIAAVLAAGGSLTGAQQTAINVAVLSLKAQSLWTKLHAWMPIVGGTSGAHCIDFKTATARGTNVNSPTHSASGVKSNGTTSYMSTDIIPTTLGATGSFGCTTKEARSGGNKSPMGSNDVTNQFRLYLAGDGNVYPYFGGITYNTAAGTAAGNHAVVRESATSLKSMFNGSVTNTNAASVTVSASSLVFKLLADNQSGATSLHFDHFCTQFWFGIAMTPAEIATLNGITDILETAMGR